MGSLLVDIYGSLHNVSCAKWCIRDISKGLTCIRDSCYNLFMMLIALCVVVLIIAAFVAVAFWLR